MTDRNEGRDLNDLTRSVLYQEVPNQNLMRLTTLVIGAAFFSFIAWSAITNVNEVAQAKGEIIPNGYAQVVQHLEGGIVSGIMVEEGDLVAEGQILVRMGGIGAEEDFAALRGRQTQLLLLAERLRALAYDKSPDFAEIAEGDDAAVAYQQRILASSRQAYMSEKTVLENQLAQKTETIERLKAQRSAAEKELAADLELLKMKQILARKGTVSRKDVIDSERDVARAEGRAGSVASQITEGEQTIVEYRNRLVTLDAQTRDKALQELEEVKSQIATNKEMLGKLMGRVDRMTIRSPVRGLVKGLRVNTVGGIISAGQPIMEIVPLDRTLVVEAHIPPSDIGNLQVGQMARVKVSAFEFSRYGIIEGRLSFLSATTFVDENRMSFYKGRIVLAQDHVGTDRRRNLILPGMTVQTDIITGEKTVLAYLLKPIHTSLNSAFRER